MVKIYVMVSIFFPIVPSKWVIILSSFVLSSIISCVKLSLFSFPWKAIPCLARYLKHLIILSKYFVSFLLTLTRLSLVISPTFLHFRITTRYEAALLWQYVCLLMFCETSWCFFSRTKPFGSVWIFYIPFSDQSSFLSLHNIIEPKHCIKSMRENEYSRRSEKKLISFFLNERVE